jgi:hypothetical protein
MPHSTTTLNGQASDVWNNYWKYGALGSGSATQSAFGTELSGGSPAYARVASTAGTSSGGANTATTQTFNCPSGSAPSLFGGFSASTAGTYAGYASFTAISFSSQGTLAVAPTVTQS